jgi:cytochrome c oxidase cbb3-type subunit I/II
VTRIVPMYWVRVVGGLLFVSGIFMCGFNMLMTWRRRPATYEEPVHEAPALDADTLPLPPPSQLEQSGAPVLELGRSWAYFTEANWHRLWERRPLRFTVWTTVAVLVASLFEIVPTFLVRSNVPSIASVKPYTPLELLGRDLYLAEGCYNCHSQMVRPMRAETERYGEYSKPGEFVYDHPFQWGSRRIGPDLHRVGGKYPYLWHIRHMEDPTATTPQSIMPRYPWLLEGDTDFAGVQARVDAMAMLGVPYGEALKSAEAMARAQAKEISDVVVAQGGPSGLERKQIIALVAYLQRLGTDIKPQMEAKQ